MIKFRVCQNCGSRIDSPTAFFCASCGNLLEKKTPASAPPSPQPSSPPTEEGKRIKFYERPALFVWVLVFLVLALSLFAFLFRGRLSEEISRGSGAVLLADFHFNTDNEVLEKPFLSEGVPDRVDFYLSGRNAAAFFEKVMSAEALHLFEKATGLNLQEAASYLEPGFAFFGEGESLAFLARRRVSAFLEEKVKEISENPPGSSYRPYLYENQLLVTNSEKLAGEVEEALAKKRLNLSLRASFAEGWRLSPHRGQFFLYVNRRAVWPKVLTLLFGPTSGPLLGDKIKGQVVLISAAAEGTYLRGGIYGE